MDGAVAASTKRILKLKHGELTFRYRASDTDRLRFCTLNSEQFIRRFLRHVLPKGVVKGRYCGF